MRNTNLKKILSITGSFVLVASSLLYPFSMTKADTLGGGFTSIPIYDNENNEVSSDLNLQVGGKVDGGVYYVAGVVPSSMTGQSYNGKSIQSSCSDTNNSCVQAGKPALFTLSGDTNTTDIVDVLQFKHNGNTPYSSNLSDMRGIHQNSNGTVFFIEWNDSGEDTNVQIWNIQPTGTSDYTQPKFLIDAPLNLNNDEIRVGSYQGMSIVEDYLFIHGSTYKSNYDDNHKFPYFSTFDLSGTSPTLIYSTPANWKKGLMYCFSYGSDVGSVSDIDSDNISSFNIGITNNSTSDPFSYQNACLDAGKPYIINATDEGAHLYAYIKGMFAKNGKLYSIIDFASYDDHYGNIRLRKHYYKSNGSLGSNDIGSVNKSKLLKIIGDYHIMTYDFSEISP